MASPQGKGPWALKGDVMLPSGRSASFSLQAKRAIAGDDLRWHLRHVLAAVGMPCDTKCTSVHLRFNEHVAEWDAWLGVLGFNAGMCRGRSLESMRRRGELTASTVDAEQEYWVSSIGLLAIIQCFYWKRRSIQDRDRARLLLMKLLSRVLGDEEMFSFDFNGVGSDVKDRCQKERHGASGQCVCLHTFLANLAAGQHEAACVRLTNAFVPEKKPTCSSVVALLAAAMRAAASRMDDLVEEWGAEVKPEQIMMEYGPSGKKRRRLDASIKSDLLARSQQKA